MHWLSGEPLAWAILALAGALGAAVGSFANLAAWRLARDLPLARPGSFCDACRAPLPRLALVPILGWIITRGRCRSCAARVPVSYPLIELAFALAAVGACLLADTPALAGRAFVFIALLGILSYVDLAAQLVPVPLAVAGILGGLAFTTGLAPAGGVWEALGLSALGAAAGAAPILVVKLVRPDGIGEGDAWFLALVGTFVGWQGALVALVAGSVLGGVTGMLLLYAGKVTRTTRVPFVPFLAAGGIVAFLWTAEIWRFYFG